jgi:hypothetical protein
MNRNFLCSAIIFSAIATVAGILQGVVALLLPHDMLGLESLKNWVLLLLLVNAIASILLVIYLHNKEYKAAFVGAIVSTSAMIFYLFVAYRFISARQLGTLVPVSFYCFAISQTVFALSLLLSGARERKLLKVTGVLILLGSVSITSLYLFLATTVDASIKTSIETTIGIVSILNAMIPILLIKNFVDEFKKTQQQEDYSLFVVWPGLMGFIIMIIFGTAVMTEVSQKLKWEQHLALESEYWKTIFQQRKFYGATGDSILYELLNPEKQDSSRRYPLVVCLPYNRGVVGSPPAQLLVKHRTDFPCFIYVPYCPDGKGWGGVQNYPTLDSIVFESLDSLIKSEKAIDANKIYVTGVSRGGFGSWHFIGSRPHFFAAAVPVCGSGDTTAGKKIKDVPVWAFHGEKDLNVPVSGSRDMIAAIRKAGGHPQYTEFEDAQHNIWDKVAATPGLLEWLFAQQKRSTK